MTPEKPETLSAVGLTHTNMMCGHPNAAGWSYTHWIYVPSIYVNTRAAASDAGLPTSLGAGPSPSRKKNYNEKK
jgi:hypothetical protein